MKFLLAMLLASSASAQRTIMEQVPSSRYAIKVDTENGRIDVATTSYNWGIASVGLHVASNVVVDTLAVHNGCVIYATGSVTCLGQVLGGVGPQGPIGLSGQSNLAVATGTSTGFGSTISSPTAVINFDYPTFTVGLEGNATAYVSINAIPTGAVNSSTITTAFQAVGVSTNALAVSTGVFKVWQATESVNVASLNLSTQSLAGGSATAYLHVDGSNYMTGQLSVQSSATISGTSGLLVTSTITVGGYSGIPRMDTYANLKTQAVSGTAWFAYATDLKQFVFYSGLSSIGDNGWFIP